MLDTYTLTEQVVDPQTGEVLGFAGETNPERFMDCLAWFHAHPEQPWPQWWTDAYNSCQHSGGPEDEVEAFLDEMCEQIERKQTTP